MDYYIRGNEKRADEIKAAYKRLWVDTNHYGVADDYYLYYSLNGLLYFEVFSNALLNVFKSHPGYKELELSAKPMFKAGDWIVGDGDIFKITRISTIITLIPLCLRMKL